MKQLQGLKGLKNRASVVKNERIPVHTDDKKLEASDHTV